VSRRAPHRGGQVGESLLELLVAVTLLGTASVSILGAFGTLIKTSNTGRRTGEVSAVLSAAAEAVADNARNPYVPCPALTAYDPRAGVTLPDGFVPTDVAVSAVRYWNGVAGFTDACQDAVPEWRLQLVTVRVLGKDRAADRTIDVVKRG
jgi:type II secretory pathway pseudopilin PulG